MEIINETTFGTWKSILKYIYENGSDFEDENKRLCREVINLSATIEEPKNDITKPVETLNSFGKWVYPSLEEIENIMISKKMAPYEYSYGSRLFGFYGKINQIDDFIIPLLKQTPSSRRAIAVIWGPVIDSKVHRRDIPGMVALDFKLRKNKLNITSLIRSNDTFFGWPANIYQIYTLQRYVSKKLNVKTGSLTTFSTSAHIFSNQFEYIEKIINH